MPYRFGLFLVTSVALAASFVTDSAAQLKGPANAGWFGDELVVADFNGDGFDDAAIGAQAHSFGGSSKGSVNFVFGTSSGLSSDGNEIVTLDDISGATGQPGAAWGSRMDAGDFNGDGIADLVSASYWYNVGPANGAGAVAVVYGSRSILKSRSELLTRNTFGIPGLAASQDHFGTDVVVGDFDGDGFDDVAIGVQGLRARPRGGLVHVIYGSAAGLQAVGSQLLTAHTPDEEFGRSLEAADFDGDGADDLVVSAPRLRLRGAGGAGGFYVYRGSKLRLSSTADLWHHGRSGLVGSPRSDEEWGSWTTAGDFDGDGFADLAVGFRTLVGDAHGTHIVHGSRAGLQAANDYQITPSTPGIVASTVDPVFAGDYDQDGMDDLFSVDRFAFIRGVNTGILQILRGTTSQLSVGGGLVLHRGLPGIDGLVAENYFGSAAGIGDFDDDGFADLIVGAPEIVEGRDGSANTFAGSASGIDPANSTLWFRNPATRNPRGTYPGNIGVFRKDGAQASEPAPASPHSASVSLVTYPNPIRDQATFRLDVSNEGPVAVAIFDALGRVVMSVVDENISTGIHTFPVSLGSANLKSGIYFVRVIAQNRIVAYRQLVVIR